MKHAFLIIAHAEYPVLEVLLRMLDDERNDVYLHVDRRSAALYDQVALFRMKRVALYLLPRPMKVCWGDISQVEVEYLLFQTAAAQGPYAYYHLLSGVDLPIQTQDDIHAFFQKHQGKEFVGFWQDARHQRDLDRKVSRYYLFTKQLKENKGLTRSFASCCRNVVLAVQKATRYRRTQEMRFMKGPNWVSVTHSFVTWLIEQKPFVMKRFRYTLCPDEIFLQTLLWNSSFKDKVYSWQDAEQSSLRKIDWQRGNPYVWKEQDCEELFRSDKLFARKFSSSEMELIHRIEQRYGRG